MLEYSYQDLESLYSFTKKHPHQTLRNWFDYRSKTLTKEERTLFKDVKFTKIRLPFNGREAEFLLFTGNDSEPITSFVNKFSGNRDYYHFYNGSDYGNRYLLITFDNEIFDEDIRWNPWEPYKGVEFLENKEIGVKIIWDNSDCKTTEDEELMRNFFRITHEMEHNCIFFWNEWHVNFYIEDISKFKFEDAINLIQE